MITRFGNIKLAESRSVQSLSLSSASNIAEHARTGAKANIEHVANALDEWRAELRLSHHFCDPQTALNQLLAAQRAAQAAPLIFNYFDYQGWAVITDLQISFRHTADNGRPLTIGVSLTFKEFVGDTATPPPAPAVQLRSVLVPAPRAVLVELPAPKQKQPLEWLADAIIAAQRARRLIRLFGDAGNSSDAARAALFIGAASFALSASGVTDAPLAALSQVSAALDAADAIEAAARMASTDVFFASAAAMTAARWIL